MLITIEYSSVATISISLARYVPQEFCGGPGFWLGTLAAEGGSGIEILCEGYVEKGCVGAFKMLRRALLGFRVLYQAL